MYHKKIIRCTPEHPFYVRQINKMLNETTNKWEMIYGEPEWKPANQLNKNDYFGMIMDNSSLLSKCIEDQYEYFDMEYHWKYEQKTYFLTIDANGVAYSWHIFKSIQTTEVENVPVYNFEVANDNSYIVENTIVHNCQSFSNGGKKKGFGDDRGNLFEYILKIAVAKRPSFMFLENVKHIKKIDNGKVFTHILNRINETGYVISEKSVFELSPHELGIPQQRERVIFVCIRNDIYDESRAIIIQPPFTPIQLDLFIEKDAPVKYKISPEIETVLNIWDEMIKIMEVGETLSPTIMCNEFNTHYDLIEWNALPDWKQEYITKNKPIYQKYKAHWDAWYEMHKNILQSKEVYGKLEWQTGKKKENDSIFNHFIQFRQSGIRVKKSEYFPTLVAIVQTPIYAKEKRYITPRECARLQSFPDSFKIHSNDHTAYKQFGNAVNVQVVKYVMEQTLKLYEII